MNQHTIEIVMPVLGFTTGFFGVLALQFGSFWRKVRRDNKVLLEALDKRDKVIENFRTTQHKLQTAAAEKDGKIGAYANSAIASENKRVEMQATIDDLQAKLSKLTPIKGANGKFVKKNSIDSRVAEAQKSSPSRRNS